jgi:hypothetical protein
MKKYFMLALCFLTGGCYWTAYTGAKWSKVESFKKISKQENIKPCYVTEQGLDVWQYGLEKCIEQKEVEWVTKRFFKQLKMPADSVFGMRIIFSSSRPDCGAFEDCGGMVDQQEMTAVVSVVDWRRILKHEIFHVVNPNDPNHWDYRWEFLNLMHYTPGSINR